MRQSQQGFTLIELVVVIVILGILAAFAIPRFININVEARQAAVQGLAGSLRSATALLHGLAVARNAADGTITLEGQAIDMANFYPKATAAGIGRSLNNLDGFDSDAPAAGQIRYFPKSTPADKAMCSVTYKEAGAGEAATVTVPATFDCS